MIIGEMRHGNPREGGTKSKEVGGTKFAFLFQGKIIALNRLNVFMFMSKCSKTRLQALFVFSL